MDNAVIAELLALAYALYLANNNSCDGKMLEPEEFFEFYHKNIQEFRNLTGASRPYSG